MRKYLKILVDFVKVFVICIVGIIVGLMIAFKKSFDLSGQVKMF